MSEDNRTLDTPAGQITTSSTGVIQPEDLYVLDCNFDQFGQIVVANFTECRTEVEKEIEDKLLNFDFKSDNATSSNTTITTTSPAAADSGYVDDDHTHNSNPEPELQNYEPKYTSTPKRPPRSAEKIIPYVPKPIKRSKYSNAYQEPIPEYIPSGMTPKLNHESTQEVTINMVNNQTGQPQFGDDSQQSIRIVSFPKFETLIMDDASNNSLPPPPQLSPRFSPEEEENDNHDDVSMMFNIDDYFPRPSYEGLHQQQQIFVSNILGNEISSNNQTNLTDISITPSSSSSFEAQGATAVKTCSPTTPTKSSTKTTGLPRRRSSLELEDTNVPGKRIRIAHQPSFDPLASPHAPIPKPRKGSLSSKQALRKTLLERYQKLSQQVQQSSQSPKISFLKVENPPKVVLTVEPPPPTERFQMVTVNKYSKRVAHTPSSSTTNGKPFIQPLPVPNCHMISQLIRRNFVEKIHSELLLAPLSGSKKVEDLMKQALAVEQDICVRSKNVKSIYISLGASKVQAIRLGDDPTTGKRAVPSSFPRQVIQTSKSSNFSVVKREKLSYKSLDPVQLVELLSNLTIPVELLEKYGFPMLDKDTKLAIFPINFNAIPASTNKVLEFYQQGSVISCVRCHQEYVNPQNGATPCVYHPGRIFKFRTKVAEIERQYSCCKADPQAHGCNMATYHVTNGYEFADSHFGFVRASCNGGQKKASLVALDCEMCYTELGLELTRITVMDFEGVVQYDTLVRPKTRILDYNTEYSGIKAGDLDHVNTTIEDVQRELLDRFISPETILIGHGLDSDCRALKLFHERVVDTTHLFPHRRGLPWKRALKGLASLYLSEIIQNRVEKTDDDGTSTGGRGPGHDSAEDAKAALELVKLKLQEEVNKMTAAKAKAK